VISSENTSFVYNLKLFSNSKIFIEAFNGQINSVEWRESSRSFL